MGAIAVYSGTFDPLTNGHANIVERASKMFDHVVLAVAISTLKSTCFSIDERIGMANEVLAPFSNVETKPFDGLIVDFARSVDAAVILRGVRGVTDFDYELQMAGMNRNMAPELDTVFLSPDDGLGYISSTLVRQIASLGGTVDQFVHPIVREALAKRFSPPA
jgi:pantetheine-phosphate adenylyltransferase